MKSEVIFHARMEERVDTPNPEKLPTIKEIAQKCGKSWSSVQRFLDPQKRSELSRETREAIEQAILEYGLRPEVYAKKKSRARKKLTIGILSFPSKDIFQSGYHQEILSGIHDRGLLASHDLKFFIFKENDYKRIEDILYERGTDGLLVLSWRCHPKVVELVEKAPGDLPLVVFNDYTPDLKVNILHTDVKEGVRQGVFYLEKRDCGKIAFLGGPKESVIKNGSVYRISSFDAQAKLEGFLGAMKEKNLSLREEWVLECPSYHQGDSYQAIKTWLAKVELPQAIVCANDAIALDTWRVLKEFKLWPGEKMALIGFDDIKEGRVRSPSLTTVRQPLYQMGCDAVEILLEKIQHPGGKKEPIQTCYAPELIVRQTA